MRNLGQSLTEYALILALVAVVAIAGLMATAGVVGGILSDVGSALAGGGNVVEGAPCDLGNGHNDKGHWHKLPNGKFVCNAS